MKEHFKKYGTIYQIIMIAICLILSCVLVYFGSKKRKEYRYTEEEAIGIMKLKADQFTRMIEIQSDEGSCINTSSATLTDNEMETYGFDSKLYKKVIYTMQCKDEKQEVIISITGNGEFSGYELANYISNQIKQQ